MNLTHIQDKVFGSAAYSNPEDQIVEVSTGEVQVGEGEIILNASALGSCIAVVAFDLVNRRGGMAHIMLPGRARHSSDPNRFRFAENGIEALFISLQQRGTLLQHIRICIAGAANVLQRSDDTLCASNIESVRKTLLGSGLSVSAESVGGVVRRRLRLYLPAGHVECFIGDDPPFCLWKHSDDYCS